MTKVVVVGAGMAAARLAETLHDRDVDATIRLTIIGAERQLPYNRVLLSAALTDARRLDELRFRSSTWYRKSEIELVRSTRVVAIDRVNHRVVCADGRAFGYDKLVLATGASAVLPPIRGIIGSNGKLHPAVGTFRTYDDCRRLLARVKHARRAVVVGGGLLGIEAARGLVARGLEVDIVHAGAHLMHDQLDADAGAVLRQQVELLGIGVHTGLHAQTAYTHGHELKGMRLSDRYQLDCDLAVLACGSRPAARLATAAGLSTRRGVVVDDRLRSVDDDAIHAIGDCAEHNRLEGGQAATAWAQADALALGLLDGDARYIPAQRVIRLRAAGLDVAAVGDSAARGRPNTHVVRLHNPARASYKSLAFRENRLVGGVFVGDTDGAAALAAALDRPWLPANAATMLLGTAAAAARDEAFSDATISGATVSDDTIVCACSGVTARTLRAAADLVHADGLPESASALDLVVRQTRAGAGCGGCRPAVSAIVEAATALRVSP